MPAKKWFSSESVVAGDGKKKNSRRTVTYLLELSFARIQ